MIRILFAATLAGMTALPAAAANLSKTYSYFSIGGSTLEQLEMELSARGPQVKSTGQRHPGAAVSEQRAGLDGRMPAQKPQKLRPGIARGPEYRRCNRHSGGLCMFMHIYAI